MMNWIRPGLHQVLDFVTVVGFAVAPTALGLEGLAGYLAYALSIVHLSLTLLTRFAPAGRAPVPLRIHGIVEMLVGPVLLALPFVFDWQGVARSFYLAAGTIIVAAWAFTAYELRPSRVAS